MLTIVKKFCQEEKFLEKGPLACTAPIHARSEKASWRTSRLSPTFRRANAYLTGNEKSDLLSDDEVR
jgi:hypothetical protein